MIKKNTTITYCGRSSDEFGLRLLNDVTFKHPSLDLNLETIPGIDGSLFETNGRYNDIEMIFPMKVFAKNCIGRKKTLPEIETEIVSWLMADPGWHDLYFEGDPNWVYKAIYTGGGSLVRRTAWEGDIDLKFTIHPFKFLRNGQNNINFDIDDQGRASLKIHNPTSFIAYPIINIKGSVYPKLEFTDGNTTQELIIHEVANANLVINTEYGIVYDKTTEVSAIDKIRSYPFPNLKPGENTISSTAGIITELSMIPNFRTLV